LREALVQAGRRADDVKIFLAASVVVAPTAGEARDLLADYRNHASREAGLAHFAAGTGIDFGSHGLDDPIDFKPGNAIQSHARAAQEGGWTRRKMLEMFELGSRFPLISGDASQVADQILSWVAETGIDGFNLTRTVVPECHESFVDLVVPALQDRGAYKTSYEEGTLRHKLHGEGDRLPERHAASAFRRSPS